MPSAYETVLSLIDENHLQPTEVSMRLVSSLSNLGLRLGFLEDIKSNNTEKDASQNNIFEFCHGFSLKWLEYSLLKEEVSFLELVSQIMLYGDELYIKIKSAQMKTKDALTQEDKTLLTIFSLYESLVLYQYPTRKNNISLTQCNIEMISHLVAQEPIRNIGGLKTIYTSLNIYTIKHISTSLSNFRQIAQQAYSNCLAYARLENSVVGFKLGSADHSIGMIYNIKDDCWQIGNINKIFLELIIGCEVDRVADIIFSAFVESVVSKDSYIIYNTKIINLANNILNEQLAFEVRRCFSLDVTNKETLHKVDSNGYSLCWIAAQNGSADILEELAKHGVDINLPDKKNGVSPIWIAAQNGHVEAIEILVKYGGKVNIPRLHANTTPVWIAAYSGHSDVIDVLIKHGADINIPDQSNGATPVWIAARRGYGDVIDLLVKHRAKLHIPSYDGRTPLFIAAERGHVETVIKLITYGADIDTVNNDSGTPIYFAAHGGHSEVVSALIQYKSAHINTGCCKSRETPIWAASCNGHERVVEELINCNADLNKPDHNGATPVYIAAQNGHAKVIETLAKNGAKVDIPDATGVTPILIAAYDGNANSVGMLAKYNANINAQYNGVTPIYLAAQNGHYEVVMELIKYNANINLSNPVDGTTPLAIAIQKGFKNIVIALEKYLKCTTSKKEIYSCVPPPGSYTNGNGITVAPKLKLYM